MPLTEERHEPSPSALTGKGVVVWAVLIVLFTIFYLHFGGRWDSRWNGMTGLLVTSLLLASLTGGALFHKLRGLWRDRRWETWAQKATQFEARGLLTEASSQWAALAKRAPPGSWAWGDTTLRQAWALLRDGRMSHARELLATVLSSQNDHEQQLALSLSVLVLALEGRVPQAGVLMNTLKDERVLHGVVGGLAPQILLLRRGEFSEALARAVPPWDIADPECRHFRHVWALLRAFTLEHLEPVPQRDVQRTRAELRGVRPQELGYLTAQWPELQVFLASCAAMRGEAPSAIGTSERSTGPRAFTRAAFGLGLPANRDPESRNYDPRRAVWMLVTFGGFLSLPFLSHWNGVLQVLLVFVLVFAAVVGVFRPLGFWTQNRNPNIQGLHAMAEMRLGDAKRLLEQALKDWADPVVLSNLGSALYKLGERSLARRLFHALSLLGPKQRYTCSLALGFLADCEATEGNLGRARLLAERAERLWKEQSVFLRSAAALVLALREGDAALVSELVEQHQRPGMGAHHQRRVMLLHTLMLEGVPRPTPEQQEQYARLHAQLREQVLPGEFDYLAPEWPELRAFLQSLGKSGPRHGHPFNP